MKISMKKFVTNSSIYKKLVITFSVIIFISVILLSSILYYNYSKSSLEIWNSLNNKLLSQVSYSSVYMDELAQNFCKSLFLDNKVKAYIYNKNQDIIITGNAIRAVQAYAVPNSYIHSVYIYNSNLDLFISSKDGGFYNTPDFYDQEIINIAKEQGPSLLPIPRKINSDNVYTYIMYEKNGDGANKIILNVNTDWLTNTIKSLHNKTDFNNGNIFILNQDGIVVNHSQPNDFLLDYSNKSYINKILSSTTDYGAFTDKIDNQKYMISFVSSNTLNWKFVSIIPYELISNTIKNGRNITLLFCLFVLLLGLGFTRFASKKLYTPIKNLVTGLQSNTNLSYSPFDNNDEIAFLATSLNKICDKSNILQKNKYLKSLLGISNHDIDEERNKIPTLNINENKNMSLFILKIDHYKQLLNQTNENNRTICKSALLTIINNLTSEYFTNEVISNDFDHFIILVNIEADIKKEELNQLFNTVISHIQKYISDELQLSLSAAYGYPIKNIISLPALYKDVLETSLYRINQGHKCIISTEILNTISDDGFTYPSSEESKLLDALKLGKLNDAKTAYFNIIDTISKYSYDCIMSSIIYLNFTIYNTLTAIKTLNDTNFLNNYIKFFENIWNQETLNDINIEFIHFMELIINHVNKSTDNKSDIVVTNMLSIINKKYSDKNLCLNYIAAQLNMSSVYIGRLFKQSTQKSVAKFIMDLRMQKMKELLETSQLNLNKILETCGIENNNYFYTIFKKYFGISLSSYKLTLSEERVKNLSE